MIGSKFVFLGWIFPRLFLQKTEASPFKDDLGGQEKMRQKKRMEYVLKSKSLEINY